ncbi:MAG: 4Fe-4S binding protein [Armatimonadetes bacterium]|nr:4Fe-4S binding protein [Armatimonadota bacterium]
MEVKNESIKPVEINQKWCKGCGICVSFCRQGALALNEAGRAALAHPERCNRCGLCEELCPDFALEVLARSPNAERPADSGSLKSGELAPRLADRQSKPSLGEPGGLPKLQLERYLRRAKLPHLWCPGCGNGLVVHALLKAVHQLSLDQNRIVVVAGIGCAGRAAGYLDFDTLHTTHGRALAFATGVKLARPELTVIVLMGDGDAAAIGGNHLIHAARRNIDLTAVVFNNSIYGMTGGQYSPLTPTAGKGTTAPYGNIERPFDLPALVQGAGGTYVARATTYHNRLLTDLIKGGLQHRGFAFIEAITYCPTAFGRQNKAGSPADALRWQREHAMNVQAYRRLAHDERRDRFPVGLLYCSEAPEYVEASNKLAI